MEGVPAVTEGAGLWGSALAQGVAHLPWLSPDAASLGALARPQVGDVWSEIRSDPGAVLLLVRGRSASEERPVATHSSLNDPALLEEALRHLDGAWAGFVNWNDSAVFPVYQAGRTIAALAHYLAKRTGRCSPEDAWVCGLLAPLGWYAVCALDPSQAAACLADPAFRYHPTETQQKRWGLDHAAIGRRLARRWNLPGWLAAVVGHLGLPEHVARTFRADVELFHLTRLAVGLAEQQGACLGLATGSVHEAAAALGLGSPRTEEHGTRTKPDQCQCGKGTLNGATSRLFDPPSSLLDPRSTEARTWEDPRRVPLLRDLLRAEAESRRLRNVALHQSVEQDADQLHRALEDQVRGEAERLRACKLAALAEFAAGAGHEINNPLSVISGQAQYLLNHLQKAEEGNGNSEENEASSSAFRLPPSALQKSLQTIVVQARRIHDLLREVMQFARPAPPRLESVDLSALVAEVATSLADLAARRQVRLETPPYGPGSSGNAPVHIYADAGQVRAALTSLLRNAIEAAPAEGWARVGFQETSGQDFIEVTVEDSGPGPLAEQREHLFDPFYSGRSAGRGRGLGLPTAWRLARQQGGDVRLAPPCSDSPTRFILSLPRSDAANGRH
jgi:signal transduction histidine kinase